MTKIKICGLRRAGDADILNRLLPEYAGFVFADSRRKISEKTAAALRERLDPRISAVGVFVNQPIKYITDLYERGIIGLAQLHGDEDDEFIARLRASCDCEIIKSVAVGSALPRLPEGADFLLFDTAAQRRGGTGAAFDWRALDGYGGPPYFLAGGLDASNVAGAARRLRPYCVDVSTGVETDGFKDEAKIAAFMDAVREAE